MSGAIPPLLQYVFMARCLVKKHRDTFTFSFNAIKNCINLNGVKIAPHTLYFRSLVLRVMVSFLYIVR